MPFVSDALVLSCVENPVHPVPVPLLKGPNWQVYI